jgi:ATP-binding cassette subfamily B protein
MRGQRLWLIFWLLLDTGEVLGLALVLGLGGLWALKGWLTIGGLFLFYSYITRLFGPLRGLSQQVNVVQRAMASAVRVFGILDAAPEPTGKRQFARLDTALRFEHVDFSYAGREVVLRDVSFELRRGEKLALVGETGGGKTSIVSLALRLYEPLAGRVAIDGIDLREFDARSLRSRIGFVPQDVLLFPGSVLDNLRLFDGSIPVERVQQAATRARIHDRLLALPQGYDTNLTERGLNLSLGERQLLAFARALVLDPELLILDEATSSIDPDTERLIQEGMMELLAGRTAILIAHRLVTVRAAERILVVDGGRVVQQGTHAELVEQDGKYRELFRLQYLSADNG